MMCRASIDVMRRVTFNSSSVFRVSVSSKCMVSCYVTSLCRDGFCDVYTTISSDLKQIQTTSKFVLKRLNQLRDSGHGCNCKEKIQETQTVRYFDSPEITTVSTRVDELQSHHTSLVDTQNDLQNQINEMRARMEEMQQTLLTVQTDDSKLQMKSGQPDNETATVSRKNVANTYYTNSAEKSEPLHMEVEQNEEGPKAELNVKPDEVSTKTNTDPVTALASDDKSSGTTTNKEPKSAKNPVFKHIQPAKLSSGDKLISNPNFPLKPVPPAKETIEDTKKDEGAEGLQVEVVRQTRKDSMLLGEQGWRSVTQTALDEARSKMKDLEGVKTVICLDISESMATGNAWAQARTFVCNYLAGLEECRREYASTGLEVQNVALVTFGHETKIQTLYTSDYNIVRNIIDNLKLGGPSPLFGGLLYALAAAWSPRQQQMLINSFMVNTKIVLVTDGRPTEMSLIGGPDIPYNDMGATKTDILKLMEEFSQKNIEIFCIPVGDCDREFIEMMSTVAEGRVKDVTYARRLARHLHLCRNHWKQYSDSEQRRRDDATLGCQTFQYQFIHRSETFLRSALVPTETQLMQHTTHVEPLGLGGAKLISEMLPQDLTLSEEDKEDLKEIKEDAQNRLMKVIRFGCPSGPTDMYTDTGSKLLPAVGTRVRRGPDWGYPPQDSYGPGTVIGHCDNDVQVHVEWDADEYANVYCYGNGDYDLLIVDEPRVPPPGKKVVVGCLVKPGKDGRSTGKNVWDRGVVVKMNPPKALLFILSRNMFEMQYTCMTHVQVRWDDGKRGDYSYGEDGKYEIEFWLWVNSGRSASGGSRFGSTTEANEQKTNFSVGGGQKNVIPTPRKNKNKNKNANVNK
ncbi:hypothetical protein MAR_024654 [Mya arenaria]|uniref:VWFA domain-containing protein n=1 Tax=Mya arenaria TaxID=6604 RepID=A0ABY7DUL5_MYAAR|nr:hypothetical protein MAR_024654 [Mya arenaria]